MQILKLSYNKTMYQLAICLLILFTACKKEDPDYPYKDITGFSIRDAEGSELKATIYNGEIIVYWPPFQAVPDSITPQIILSDRAVVSPASGEQVPFNVNTVFTVKAQDGSVFTYRLKPVINQPVPYIVWNAPGPVPQPDGESTFFTGDYFIADTTQTALYFIDSTGREIPAVITEINSSFINIIYPALAIGNYHVKLVTGIRTAMLEDIVQVVGRVKITSIAPFPLTLKAGETFTIKGENLDKINSLSTDKDWIPYDFIITGTPSPESLTVRLPADMPAGVYFGFYYTTTYSSAFTSVTEPLTIEE